jgi:lysophospholipase L1-like esterase
VQKYRISLLVAIAQVVLASGAIIMAVYVQAPLVSIIGLVVSAASAIAYRATSASTKPGFRWIIVAAWAGTALALASPLFARAFTFDDYYGLIAACMTVTVFAASLGETDESLKSRWHALGLAWAFVAAIVWLVTSCVQNRRMEFYGAVLLNVALLLFCRLRFKLRAFGIQTVNTFTLLLVVLPSVDFFLHEHSREDMRTKPQNYYTYEAARKDPTAYARWTRYYWEQWELIAKQIYDPVTNGLPPFRLRPGSRGTFLQSEMIINSRGFRGAEISAEKGNIYRIVALGESTTFGVTLKPEDKPWPDLLELMIRDRLKPARPVEVINAGVPGYNLKDNVSRLARDILPLKPDMIISYHGINGFPMINGALPPPYAKPPPPYRERPLKLLADFEYAVKLASYKKELIGRRPSDHPTTTEPMNSMYARTYRELIDFARTNQIRLVLANFSMAINTNSDSDVIDFYRTSNPMAHDQIKANVVHTFIVGQLAREHPEIVPVDTQPHFDGEHHFFIDIVHLTQPGRQHLAETIFAAIKNILEQDCSAQDPPKPY